jgi:regulatory subunit for Cdc7p protein kinase
VLTHWPPSTPSQRHSLLCSILSLRMAAVYIPPSPRPFQNRSMSNRPRAPLATVPNATNSPFRGLNAAAGKRSRPQGGSIQELSHGQPPQKRQMLEKEDVDGQTHTLNPGNATSNEGRVFTRRSLNPPTAFEQKLHLVAAESAREREKQQSRSAKIKATKGDQESMRVWRDHYRQAFPSYVFYFDSVPEDIRSRAAKQLAKFGAVSFFPIIPCLL